MTTTVATIPYPTAKLGRARKMAKKNRNRWNRASLPLGARGTVGGTSPDLATLLMLPG